MVSWALINSFGLPAGIYVLRNALPFYRNLRATYNSRKTLIRDTPPQVSTALNILFAFAVAALLYTLPFFSPSNVFTQTNARLQTSNEVIFTRLAAIRPLTDFDLSLKAALTSANARLMYFVYGPDTVVNCTFCKPSDGLSYLYYCLPSLLAPHLVNMLLLGLVTSSFLSGPEGARWRTQATLGGLALAAVDIYFQLSYDISANSRSTNVRDIDFFFWRMRVARGLCIAALDGLLGWAMWLSATNRFFISPPSVGQRIDAVTRALEVSNFRTWAAGNVRNAVVRNKDLREGMAHYWTEEKEVFENREVVNAIKSALERNDMRALHEAADLRSKDILNYMGTG